MRIDDPQPVAVVEIVQALREALAQRDYAKDEAAVFFADAMKLQTQLAEAQAKLERANVCWDR